MLFALDCTHWAEHNAFFAVDALFEIDCWGIKSFLDNCTYRANSDRGAGMILRTTTFRNCNTHNKYLLTIKIVCVNYINKFKIGK